MEKSLSGENTEFEKALVYELATLENLLLTKNRKYGNSALEPKRIFARSDAIEQINVRIDDKLSRIGNQAQNDDEDAELDLIGYLVLKRIAIRVNSLDSE